MNTVAQHTEVGTAYNFNRNFLQSDALTVASDGMDSNTIDKPRPVVSSINVPTGWNRILDNGTVVYISPNKSRLRSINDIKTYLLSAATCKCGLPCQFQPEEVFSFSPNVETLCTLNSMPYTRKKDCQCNIEDGFQRILSHFTPEKLAKLIKKGSKKKKKRSKGFDKDGKKRIMRKGQRPNSIRIEPWMNFDISQKGIAVSCANKNVIGNETANYNQLVDKTLYKKHIGVYQQNQSIQSVDIVEHLTTPNLSTTLNGDSRSAQGNAGDTSTGGLVPTDNVATNCKGNFMKSSAKRGQPKSKRVPKSKEDLNIASMMGRVKQQVGDLNKIRSSQMFTLPHQSVSRQESTTAVIGEKKNNVSLTASTPATKSQSNVLKGSPAVLNSIDTKGPPNVTLPLSHSNMLPKAVTKGLRYPSVPPLQNISQFPAVSRDPCSHLEAQQLGIRQDPHLFSGKVSTNVYWGREDQISSRDMPLLAQESNTNLTTNNKSGNRQDIFVSESTKSNKVTNKSVPMNSLPKGTVSAPEYNLQVARQSIAKENSGISCANTSEISNFSNSSVNSKDASIVVFNNGNSSRQQNIASDVASKSSQPTENLITIGPTGNDQNIAISLRESKIVNPSSLTEDKILSNMPSTVSENSLKDQVTMHPSNAKASAGAKPFNTLNTVTVSAVSNVASSQPQQPDVLSLPNLYGVANPTSLLKGSVTSCKSNSTAGSPARFLIMGSQASQALQHLALQQSNTFQVSLQRTENSQGMYLQTLSSYNPANQSVPHGNIGFAYANVPIQLMTIGGTQVIGKQQTAQSFNFDRYPNFYRGYQGPRPFETTANDHGAQVQAASFMYPGVNPGAQPASSYIRIAPASTAAPAVSKIPVSFQARTTQHQSNLDIQEGPRPQSSPKVSPGTKTTLVPSPISSINTTISPANRDGVCVPSEQSKVVITSNADGGMNGKDKQPVKDNGASSQHPLEEQNYTALPDIAINANRQLTQSKPEFQESASKESTANGRTQSLQETNAIGTLPTGIENSNSVKSSTSDGRETDGITTANPALIRGANDGQSESSVNHEDQEEMNLKCNEPCNDVSDESRTPTPEIDTKASVKYVDENQTDLNLTAMPRKSALRLGDLIWGHQKGYSAWPGRIVSESEVKEGFTETGKVWIKWFGEHTHSQMDLNSLKSLEEGLVEYRGTKKRKNRSTKKTTESLESAIAEALEMANSGLVMSASSDDTPAEPPPEAKRSKT